MVNEEMIRAMAEQTIAGSSWRIMLAEIDHLRKENAWLLESRTAAQQLHDRIVDARVRDCLSLTSGGEPK